MREEKKSPFNGEKKVGVFKNGEDFFFSYLKVNTADDE
jgi:hypothetical protein